MMQKSIIFLFLACSFQFLKGQPGVSALTGANLNRLPISATFLTVAPDGRSSGMGDAGTASTPDVNSQHWNSGKYAFVEEKTGIAGTYFPWFRNLIRDAFYLYFAGYYQINNKSAISSSVRYFSLGTIFIVGGSGTSTPYYPMEMAVDAGYSRKITDQFSGGIVLRYIHSDLFRGHTTASGQETSPGTSLAGDLGLYYQNELPVAEREARWALGLNISNIGAPISYSADDEKIPIPTNLRLGGRFSYIINENNNVSFLADLNKLLVPTPGVYDRDEATGDLILIRGNEPPESVILGMFRSFYDAPGVQRSDGTYSVAAEELHEITFSLGGEYWYGKKFALRTGYFNEHASKGNRKYFTLGIGARYKFIKFDLSCLFPTNGQYSPLQNTFRLTLSSEVGNISNNGRRVH